MSYFPPTLTPISIEQYEWWAGLCIVLHSATWPGLICQSEEEYRAKSPPSKIQSLVIILESPLNTVLAQKVGYRLIAQRNKGGLAGQIENGVV